MVNYWTFDVFSKTSFYALHLTKKLLTGDFSYGAGLFNITFIRFCHWPNCFVVVLHGNTFLCRCWNRKNTGWMDVRLIPRGQWPWRRSLSRRSLLEVWTLRLRRTQSGNTLGSLARSVVAESSTFPLDHTCMVLLKGEVLSRGLKRTEPSLLYCSAQCCLIELATGFITSGCLKPNSYLLKIFFTQVINFFPDWNYWTSHWPQIKEKERFHFHYV